MLRAPLPAAAGAGGLGGFLLRTALSYGADHEAWQLAHSQLPAPCPGLSDLVEQYLGERGFSITAGLTGIAVGAGFALGLLAGCIGVVLCFRGGSHTQPARVVRANRTARLERVEGYFTDS